MPKLKDLTGQKFGRLTVISRAENKGKKTCWRCRCDCGNETVVRGDSLTDGRIKSCGCYYDETRCIPRHLIHGMNGTKIYRTWCTIKNRCFNKNVKNYCNYGGRGITVYPEWIDDFLAFYNYVSTLEHFGEDGYSLDRIDNNGNYEPGNLRWADNKTQCRNRRSNIIVEYEGKQMTLIEASELSGINHNTLSMRYHRGDRGDNLFRPLSNPCIYVDYKGTKITLKEASEKSGISYDTLKVRYRVGDRGDKLFRPVKNSSRQS